MQFREPIQQIEPPYAWTELLDDRLNKLVCHLEDFGAVRPRGAAEACAFSTLTLVDTDPERAARRRQEGGKSDGELFPWRRLSLVRSVM
jgi:hypothetical protein